MTSLLDGYTFKVVARLGNATDIPALIPGEIGYDVDKRVLRVGDDTATPPRIPTDKSTGDFNFSTAGTFTFNVIQMAPNGTVDGVDISELNKTSGFLVRKGNNQYDARSFVNGDGSLQITNGDGVAGNTDIRIHPSIMELINGGGYLSAVTATAPLQGAGTALSPLSLRAATSELTGSTRYSTDAEFNAGVVNTAAVTPANLMELEPGSPVAIHLTSLFSTSLSLTVGAGLTGNGTVESPLVVTQATETERGGMEIAAQVELNNGVSDVAAVTPAKLKGLAAGSDTAVALAEALGIALPISNTNVKMTGPGVLGRSDAVADQAVQVLAFSTTTTLEAGAPATNYNLVSEVTLGNYLPKGLVKPKSHVNAAGFPAANVVGAGAIGWNAESGQLQYSDGSAYFPLGGSSVLNSVLVKVGSGNYTSSSNATLQLTLNDAHFHTITWTNVEPGNVDLGLNINGAWVTKNYTQANIGLEYTGWEIGGGDIMVEFTYNHAHNTLPLVLITKGTTLLVCYSTGRGLGSLVLAEKITGFNGQIRSTKLFSWAAMRKAAVSELL